MAARTFVTLLVDPHMFNRLRANWVMHRLSEFKGVTFFAIKHLLRTALWNGYDGVTS